MSIHPLRRAYEMSQDDMRAFRAACDPNPMAMIGEAKTAAAASREFWKNLGAQMGFKWWTVEPRHGMSAHHFSAVAYSEAELADKARQQQVNRAMGRLPYNG